MIEVEESFKRQTNGLGYFAKVKMHIIESEKNEVHSHHVEGWNNDHPGVPDEWIHGARIGAQYALSKIDGRHFTIVIKNIMGLHTDTNATIVGTAIIFGIWKALKPNVEQDEIDRLTSLTLNSWEKT